MNHHHFSLVNINRSNENVRFRCICELQFGCQYVCNVHSSEQRNGFFRSFLIEELKKSLISIPLESTIASKFEVSSSLPFEDENLPVSTMPDSSLSSSHDPYPTFYSEYDSDSENSIASRQLQQRRHLFFTYYFLIWKDYFLAKGRIKVEWAREKLAYFMSFHLNLPLDRFSKSSILPYMKFSFFMESVMRNQRTLFTSRKILSKLNECSKKQKKNLEEEEEAERFKGSVIFIHGANDSPEFWFQFVICHLSEEFKREFRIFVPQLSPIRQNQDFSEWVENQVDSIHIGIIQSNRLSHYHLVSFSLSSIVALEIAAFDPQSLLSLTMLSPANWEFDDRSVVSSQIKVKFLPPPTELLSSLIHSKYVKIFVKNSNCQKYAKWALRKILPEKYPSSTIHRFVDSHVSFVSLYSVFKNILSQRRMSLYFEILDRFSKRIRILHGMEDMLCPFTFTLQLAEKYSNISLMGIPKGCHDILSDREMALTWEIEKEINRIECIK